MAKLLLLQARMHMQVVVVLMLMQVLIQPMAPVPPMTTRQVLQRARRAVTGQVQSHPPVTSTTHLVQLLGVARAKHLALQLAVMAPRQALQQKVSHSTACFTEDNITLTLTLDLDNACCILSLPRRSLLCMRKR